MFLERQVTTIQTKISGRYLLNCAIVFLVVIVTNVTPVEITRLSVPRWVQNGTEDSVVLDCEYTLTTDDDRLVVKWFLNDDPEPIYQWIPELDSRHASRRLQGRLNMDYKVSPSNGYTKYRALNILRPTTDLSGRYSCHVGSLSNQDSEDQIMIVYAPPRIFDFNFTKFAPGMAKFTCEADRVYPLPRVSMYRRTEADDPRPISSTQTIVHQKNGAFTIQISQDIRDREFPSGQPVTFECILSIPGTNFQLQRRMIYYPGEDVDHAITSTGCVFLLTIMFTVLHYLIS
ncbi:uncharacterized protein [Centruroides vittatus]|uniref:uncharacterized protein n=1 Tax=Centruroides vittatus TaxID=120091 RepID=UPI00350FD2BF